MASLTEGGWRERPLESCHFRDKLVMEDSPDEKSKLLWTFKPQDPLSISQ
ncbi:hypothetical protein Scep_030165 [Stephania cephalantha]|uniref:Uncharacterized protein n=1 Tax=Stephania cephalantha TaxID=152367 RepID=A0AAP0E6S0_9MAGN